MGAGRSRGSKLAASASAAGLGDAETLLGALLAHSPDSIHIKDREGRYLAVSQRFREWTGMDDAAILDRRATDVMPPRVLPEVEAADRDVLEHGESRTFVIDLPVAEGGERRVEVLKFPIRDGEGRIIAVGTVGRDITRGQEREAVLQGLLAHSPDLIALKDLEGRFLFASQRFEEWIGSRVAGRRSAELVTERMQRIVERLERQVAETGAAVREVVEVGVPGLGQRWVEFTKFPVWRPNGTLRAIGTLGRDVTAIEEHAAALRASEERYALAIAGSAAGIWDWDLRRDRLYCSPRMLEILGLGGEETEILPVRMYDLMVPEDREGHREALVRHLRGEAPYFECESRIRLPGGGVRWMRYRGLALRDESGRAYRMAGSAIDETQRIESEREARRLSEELSWHASHDELTGLVNRREFERRLELALREGQARGQCHTLCYLDLDQFKVVNDTCGHAAGDLLLRRVAELMTGRLRSHDTIARLGGDEFGVLLEQCGAERGRAIMEALVAEVHAQRFVWEERVFRPGVSAGLVEIRPGELGPEQALARADAACYAAKEDGRGRVHVYRESDTGLEQRHREMQWVARITSALEENRLCLWAQPIRSLRESAPPGARLPSGHPGRRPPGAPPSPASLPRGDGAMFELLVRLVERDGTLVPPGAFLPAAERFSLAPRIDRWVISHALAWLAAHPRVLEATDLWFINVSGQSIGEPSLEAYIEREMRLHGIPPGKICIELTETAAVASFESAAGFMTRARRHGVQAALDDFGSGLSSFAYLRSLPVDFLKIDGAFVRDIATDPVARAMVRSINEVAQAMGKLTIAEFVENDRVRDALVEMGVDFAQGFGLGRPVPLEEVPLLVGTGQEGRLSPEPALRGCRGRA